jgi:hypothetical protein
MKRLLGAIAAAMVLGAGCAHERGNQTQTEMPAPPQASVDNNAQGQLSGAGGAGTAGGVDCTVINGGAADTSAIGGASSQPAQSATGGSSWDLGNSDQSGIGGSASEAGAVDDTAIDSPAPETGAMDDNSISDSDTQSDAFEDTGMGGAGGGGG